MYDTFNRVPVDERPEATVDNVPDEVINKALNVSVSYGRCPYCEKEQFHIFVSGHSWTTKCSGCEKSVKVIG